MRLRDCCYPWDEPERSFDEKMRDGQSQREGLAGSMPMHEPWEKPYRATHRTTRSKDDADL